MKKKTNLMMLALLGVQFILIISLYWSGREKGEPMTDLMQGLAAEAVTELTITEGSGKTLTLRQEENGGWQAGNGKAVSYPADPEQVRHLLTTLTALQSRRLVTRTKSSHIRLQVDDKIFAKMVVLRVKGGETRTLFLGSSPGPQAMHVRPAATDDVYLVDGISAWELDTEPESWWQTNYVLLDGEKLQEVSLKNHHGSFTLRKEGDKWRLGDADPQQELTPAVVDDFLRQVSHININRYLDREHRGKPLDAALLSLKLADQEPLTVAIGPNSGGEDNEHVIKSSASPFFAAANNDQLGPLLEMKKENFTAAGPEAGE
jgi:hypothetical protein